MAIKFSGTSSQHLPGIADIEYQRALAKTVVIAMVTGYLSKEAYHEFIGMLHKDFAVIIELYHDENEAENAMTIIPLNRPFVMQHIDNVKELS